MVEQYSFRYDYSRGASGVDFLAERWADNNCISSNIHRSVAKSETKIEIDSGRPEAVTTLRRDVEKCHTYASST